MRNRGLDVDATQREAHAATVFAVVIDEIHGDTAALASAAASVVGGTAYDVRASLQGPEGGPAVIAVVAEPQTAEATRASLQRVGFSASVLAVKDERPHIDVRRFVFGGHALGVENRKGEQIELPYAAVGLLVRATPVTTTATTTTVRERKFNLARAALSGGLINTKTQTSTHTSRMTQSDELLFVFGDNALPLCMSECELQYQGLGPALQPSRSANFVYVVDELRRRCPHARFDERLRRRAAQTQVLGRMLSPDEHLEFAVALVARSVAARRR